MKLTKEIVGTIVIGEGVTKTRLYECAAWFDEIAIPPGEYPLTGWVDENGELSDRDPQGYSVGLRYELTGTVVASNKQSLWCGVPVSKRGINENIGETMSYVGHVAVYSLANAMLNGEAPDNIKIPGFTPYWYHFEYESRGETVHGKTGRMRRI